MGKRKKKAVIEDDGRVIAPMNIEGMPWYTKSGIRNSEFRINEREDKDTEFGTNNREQGISFSVLPLTRREKLAFSFGVLKAALLVSLVFIGALLAFILFCTEIWFR